MHPGAGERCAVQARERHEDAAGTAPVARRWLLIEHDGPWARQPLDSEPFSSDAGASIERSAKGQGAKVLLVRRPGRAETSKTPRQWFVVDTTTGLAISGTWRNERDLVAAAREIGEVAGAAADEAPPFILVCTHGVRDACCAIRGRPIAGQLARQFEGEVWECSHLGGHRLSGTLLLLPDGACYGYLDQGNAARIIRDHRQGRPSLQHLRGYTKDPQPAQAALVWAMRNDPEQAGELIVGGCVALTDGLIRVEVGSLLPDSPDQWVDVASVDLEPAQLSCGKAPEARTGFVMTATLPS